MKFIKAIGKAIVLLISLFILFVLYIQFNDYKPAVTEQIANSDQPDTIQINKVYSILNWNIGYCGLGDDMDFFYDGGTQVRTSEERTIENMEAIRNFISDNDTVDFFLLQEVDKSAKRSYYTNQLDSLKSTLNNFEAWYGTNYKVSYIPIPLSAPLGKVDAGLATFAKHKPIEVQRWSFPGNYDWPTNLFMLDRCFMVKRFPVSNGKEFILINTHNSAYDDGTLKTQQMEFLKSFLTEEYSKGNYILVGGDWNQNPPGYKSKNVYKRGALLPINKNYLPDWQWIFQPEIPTNRNLDMVYTPEKTPVTVIDFFLMSPNIKSHVVENVNLNFQNSDHQPVINSFELF